MGGLALLATNGCALMIPWLLKLAVESLQSPKGALHEPSWYGSLIIAAALLHGTVRILSRTTLLHAARRIEYRIRNDLYARLLSLDQSFFSGERTGDLISRFSNDLTNVRMLVGFGVLNIINSVIIYTAALSLMTKLSPSLALYAILPFPAMIVIVKKMSASMFRRSKRAQEELARLTSAVEENVSAAPLIKAYCREGSAIQSFRESSGRYMHSNMRVAQLRGFMIPVMASTGALGTLIVLLVGGGRVVDGTLTLGEFVAFNGYLAMLIWPTIMMGWIMNLAQRGAASMERLNKILRATPKVIDPAEPADVTALHGDIELRELTFGYGAEPVLKTISLKLNKGMRLGIVGPIGCGKSTMVRLLARLFKVDDGMIFIDGIDINRIPLSVLRGAIGYIPQEGFLFSRTIAENIAYGREGASDEDISEAARMAGFQSEVERFPDGFATLVGERGIMLSGGQKQRAAIARALLTDPAILILDDPLSAVDANTEEEILANLSSYYGNRTVLIVSHRISALRDCDLIITLKNGRIVEQGSHSQLLELNGSYAKLHREQQIRMEIDSYER